MVVPSSYCLIFLQLCHSLYAAKHNAWVTSPPMAIWLSVVASLVVAILMVVNWPETDFGRDDFRATWPVTVLIIESIAHVTDLKNYVWPLNCSMLTVKCDMKYPSHCTASKRGCTSKSHVMQRYLKTIFQNFRWVVMIWKSCVFNDLRIKTMPLYYPRRIQIYG